MAYTAHFIHVSAILVFFAIQHILFLALFRIFSQIMNDGVHYLNLLLLCSSLPLLSSPGNKVYCHDSLAQTSKAAKDIHHLVLAIFFVLVLIPLSRHPPVAVDAGAGSISSLQQLVHSEAVETWPIPQ
jgi:hypothetical protein